MPFSKEIKSDLWFSNLFKSIAISINASSRGPVTICTSPRDIFERSVVENTSIRAILSTGVGDHDYLQNVFAARIVLPKIKEETYEAIIYNFIVLEDFKQLTLKINTQALSPLIMIYPKKFRKFVNQIEVELELILSQTDILPNNVSEFLEPSFCEVFYSKLRKIILTLENEVLLDNNDFELIQLFESSMNSIESQYFLDDIISK